MQDLKIKNLIKKETKRQKEEINLIASENIISKDAASALASSFTNKYAEGYPNKRYYSGNRFVDELELLAQERALDLFGLDKNNWQVNVQPLSGSPANLAIYLALVPKSEKIMAMELSSGGHLSHGHRVSITGQVWTRVEYGVDKESGLLDYSKIEEMAVRERPKMIVVGYTAYSRFVDWQKFREIADKVGAYLLVDMSHTAGLVAGGAYSSPFSCSDIVMTTTHKTLRGPRGAIIFSKIDERKIGEKIDKAVFPGLQGGPHLNNIASMAVALKEAKSKSFKKYIKKVVENARVLEEEFKKANFKIVSGGTDTHLLILDIYSTLGFSGSIAADILEKEGIIVNKNSVPFEPLSPYNPSGIRLGSPFETSKGKNKKDFKKIALRIIKILTSYAKESN